MTIYDLESRLQNEGLTKVFDGDYWTSYNSLKHNCNFDSPNSFGLVELEGKTYGIYIAGEERDG